MCQTYQPSELSFLQIERLTSLTENLKRSYVADVLTDLLLRPFVIAFFLKVFSGVPNKSIELIVSCITCVTRRGRGCNYAFGVLVVQMQEGGQVCFDVSLFIHVSV